MKDNCFDIGTIQAFIDGELASDSLENTARHLAICGDCAEQLAAAEEETAFAFSALSQELNTLVPTQRLWTKINDLIEKERKSFWHVVFAFFRNPALAAFAAFLIVFGFFVVYLNSTSNISNDFASAPKPTQNSVAAVSSSTSDISKNPVINVPTISPTDESAKSFKVINAKYDSNPQRNLTQNPSNQGDVSKAQSAVYEYMPGEESYIKTIATLEKTVDDRKDEVLKPSSRIAYEKDLALVNDAIKNMQVEVKKNPKNESAKQVLLASYQNKVDLLNSVNGRTELMASLR